MSIPNSLLPKGFDRHSFICYVVGMELILYTRSERAALTQETYEMLLRRLHPEKRARLERLPARQRELSLLGDLLARRQAADLLGADPEELLLTQDENGRPFVPGQRVHISISHSGDQVCAAAALHPLGLDMELLRPVSDRLAEKVCSASELRWVSAGPDHAERFLRLWTMKEAYGKFTGLGVFRAPRLELAISGERLIETYPDCRFSRPEETDGIIVSLCTPLPDKYR